MGLKNISCESIIIFGEGISVKGKQGAALKGRVLSRRLGWVWVVIKVGEAEEERVRTGEHCGGSCSSSPLLECRG